MKKVVTVVMVVILMIALVNIEAYSVIDFTGFSEIAYVYNSNGEQIASIARGEHFTYEGDEELGFIVRGEIGWDRIPVEPKTRFRLSFWQFWAIKFEHQFALAAIVASKKSRRVILNYPPASSVWHLSNGISLLTAVLRNDGHNVVQRYGHIIGLEYLLKQYGGADIDHALGVIRSPNSDILSLYNARMTFETVSRNIPTDDKFAVVRNNVSYVSAYYDGTIEGIIRAVKYREQHIWYQYFNDIELALANDVRPDIYGISIADERQLVQGLILASMIKDALPETIVVLGGNFWPRIMEAYQHPAFSQIFSYCDAIVYAEGFQPLQILAETLEPQQMPGAVWFDGSKVVVNPITAVPTDFECLPTPVFDGGARQWSVDDVYPLYTMSNCPMGCEFCAISAGSDTYLSKPRSMCPRRIAQHMVNSAGHRFDIVDETFSVSRQLQLGKELKCLGYHAEWQCYLTVTDSLLDINVCRALYDAGCRGVQLGLETLSVDTLGRESKHWNHPGSYVQILSNLRDVGIQTHVFLLLALPGQPLNWDLQWLGFLEENGSAILTVKAGRYRLSKRAPEVMNNTHSEFVSLLPDDKLLRLNRGFRYLSTSRKKAEAVRDTLEQACRNHWACAVSSTLPWWTNRGRYSLEQLRQMALLLPPEPEVPHLSRSVRKVNGIIKDELGLKTSFTDFNDLVTFSKTI